MKHTEGRLTARDTRVFFADNVSGFDIRDCPDAEANARRLVACWNACEGIHTVALPQLRVALKDTQRFIGERDELVEALRACVNVAKAWHDMDGSNVWDLYYNNAPEMKPIREALAKWT